MMVAVAVTWAATVPIMVNTIMKARMQRAVLLNL